MSKKGKKKEEESQAGDAIYFFAVFLLVFFAVFFAVFLEVFFTDFFAAFFAAMCAVTPDTPTDSEFNKAYEKNRRRDEVSLRDAKTWPGAMETASFRRRIAQTKAYHRTHNVMRPRRLKGLAFDDEVIPG